MNSLEIPLSKTALQSDIKQATTMLNALAPNDEFSFQTFSDTGNKAELEKFLDSLPAPIEQTNQKQKSKIQQQISPVIVSNLVPSNHNVPKLTAERVRALARGRWDSILGRLGYTVSTNGNKHTTCPVCGGKDRFRFDNENNTGSYICSQGNGETVVGDGLSLLIDHAGMSIDDAITSVTAVLNDLRLITPYDSKNCSQTKIWCELESLNDSYISSNPYPLEAFPGELKAVVEKASDYHQTPYGVAGNALLGLLSTLCQPFVNAWFEGSFNPVSLFLMVQLISGGGKTQINNYIYKPIIEIDKARYEQYQRDLVVFNTELSALKGKEKAEYMATGTPKNESFLMASATLQFITRKFVIDDAVNLAINSGEAGKMLGNYAMNDKNIYDTIGTFADLYSGQKVEYNTSGNQQETGKTQAYDRRLTIDIAGQPIILKEIINNPLLMAQGFLARFLISCEPSMIGRRVFDDPQRIQQNKWQDPVMLEFWNKCKSFYDPVPSDNRKAIDGSLQRFNMPFSDDAEKHFYAYRQHCENRLLGQFKDYQETAQRLAENASRIATLFAYFDGFKEVSIDYFQRGILLAEYSINELMRYNDQLKITEKNDSQILIEWMVKKAKVKNTNQLNWSFIYSNAPYGMQKNTRLLKEVLIALESGNYIASHTKGKATLYEINPLLLK